MFDLLVRRAQPARCSFMDKSSGKTTKLKAQNQWRSSHGPWHLSRTYATQLAMSNEWLEQQGLVSVKDLWVSFNYPR